MGLVVSQTPQQQQSSQTGLDANGKPMIAYQQGSLIPLPQNLYTDLNSYASNPALSPLYGAVKDQVSNANSLISNFTGKNFGISSTYQPVQKDFSTQAMPQYDAIRSRLNSQYNTTQSTAQDALDRQFAAMGGGPGNGAQAKQTENLASSIAKQKGDDLSTLNAQEAAERTQLQNAWDTNESNKAFTSSENAKSFNANVGFQQAMTGLNAGIQSGWQGISANSTLAGLDMNWKQAQAKNDQEATAQMFNEAMAAYQAKHTGGLFGGGGFLGLGG